MMDISTILMDVKWNKKAPADPRLVQNLVDSVTEELPEEYLALLLYSDGGDGKLGIEPGWFQLWAAAEVQVLNKSYEIDKYLPGFFGFGSNGAGELLAFEIEYGKPWKIARIPFISMSAMEAVMIANDFEEFIRTIGQDGVK